MGLFALRRPGPQGREDIELSLETRDHSSWSVNIGYTWFTGRGNSGGRAPQVWRAPHWSLRKLRRYPESSSARHPV